MLTALISLQIFEGEVYVWSKVKHENVLQLLGYVFDEGTGYPLLISEWMPLGTAWEYVKANPNLKLLEITRLASCLLISVTIH